MSNEKLNQQKEIIYLLANELISSMNERDVDAYQSYYDDRFISANWTVCEEEAEDCGFVNNAGVVDLENFKKCCKSGIVMMRTSYKGEGLDLEVIGQRDDSY